MYLNISLEIPPGWFELILWIIYRKEEEKNISNVARTQALSGGSGGSPPENFRKFNSIFFLLNFENRTIIEGVKHKRELSHFSKARFSTKFTPDKKVNINSSKMFSFANLQHLLIYSNENSYWGHQLYMKLNLPTPNLYIKIWSTLFWTTVHRQEKWSQRW